MDTTQIGITGDKTLATINQIITQRENLNCEFQDSRIGYKNGVALNRVTLGLYDDDTVPKKLTLKKKSEPAPDNAAKVWEGEMMAENSLLAAIGYRDQ